MNNGGVKIGFFFIEFSFLMIHLLDLFYGPKLTICPLLHQPEWVHRGIDTRILLEVGM
jgi:hypothetical protein